MTDCVIPLWLDNKNNSSSNKLCSYHSFTNPLTNPVGRVRIRPRTLLFIDPLADVCFEEFFVLFRAGFWEKLTQSHTVKGTLKWILTTHGRSITKQYNHKLFRRQLKPLDLAPDVSCIPWNKLLENSAFPQILLCLNVGAKHTQSVTM